MIRADSGRKVSGEYRVNIYAAKKEAEIILYDEIGESFWGGGVSAKRFIEDLGGIKNVDVIRVRINSPGGNAFEGVAMYNAIVRSKVRIETHADGVAASVASLILMGGEKRYMAENAMVMVHNPWAVAVGDGDAMRKMADSLDVIRMTLVKTYADRTGQSNEAVEALMNDETWMDAKQASDLKFVDTVTENLKIAAHIDKHRFHYAKAPERLTAERSDEETRARVAGIQRRLLTLPNKRE